MKQLKEELLHFIWKSKLLFSKDLKLTNGEQLRILKIGDYNQDAGPDFLNCQIQIGSTKLIGNIEMHIQSSDWYAHKHQLDFKYDNVILHVVYYNNKQVTYRNGNEIPTLELYHLLPPLLLRKHEFLYQSRTNIPCLPIFKLPNSILLKQWLDRLFANRLERKIEDLGFILKDTSTNWEQSFYILTAKYIGGKVNSMPFEWLAKNLPLSIIAKHKTNLFQLRSLCYGIAGFPQSHLIPDVELLKKEFTYIKHKYNLITQDANVWKASRMYPNAFPAKRLEQFALLLYHSTRLLSRVIATNSLEELKLIYKVKHHGKFVFSNTMIDHLLINSVLPLLFMYGIKMQDQKWKELSIDFYEDLDAEENKIIRFWATLAINPTNAMESQALIELKSKYCDSIKCLHCVIGQQLVINEDPI